MIASSDEDEGEDEEESLISLDSDSQSACVSQADVQQQRHVVWTHNTVYCEQVPGGRHTDAASYCVLC